ncbi:MAG TPA: hypothetical protein VHI13_04395 [Candidatus Kapabacteria bacterium]|nr:hypothetical protein [Candidatus Kapabacteria bacterium]
MHAILIRSLPVSVRRHALRALLALALLPAAGGAARAQLREWTLADPALQTATTQALERYYSVVTPDSIRLHYIERNSRSFPYRIRGTADAPGHPGVIVLMTLGQLTIFPESTIRIALGEDLYRMLAASRTAGGTDDRLLPNDSFGADDWSSGARVIVSFDRLDVHVSPTVGVFAAMGAPEANQFWWCDGTWRLGIATPNWECALLLPMAGGATPVGPFRERLLAPAWGAAAAAHAGDVTMRARFATPGDASFDAIHTGRDYFVHTASGEASYRYLTEAGIGAFQFDVGVTYNEYSRARRDADEITLTGHARRLSPLGAVTWTNRESTLRWRAGFGDFTPQFLFEARLTSSLWLETDLACAGLFRDPATFEHPFYLYITPRIKF